jgi:hypothetical protein
VEEYHRWPAEYSTKFEILPLKFAANPARFGARGDEKTQAEAISASAPGV